MSTYEHTTTFDSKVLERKYMQSEHVEKKPRILDASGAEVIDPDLSRGRTIPENIFKQHHEAVDRVEEQGHYVTVAEYPNGGKDVEWVVDVAAVEASEAWDEYEEILRYVPYTEEELLQIEKDRTRSNLEQRIMNLEEMLELILSGIAK